MKPDLDRELERLRDKWATLGPKDQPSADWWDIDEDGMYTPALFTIEVALSLFQAYCDGLA